MLQKIVSQTRRNHALEHATIHVLSEKYKNFGAQGNSTPQGFYLNIYGPVEGEDIETAVREAYQRLQEGEHELALHPNCGTVLLTTATLATLAAQAVFGLEQKRLKTEKLDTKSALNVLPSAILATVLSLIASKPLGMYFQSFTTDGIIGDLRIEEIREMNPSPVTHFFRVLLGQNKKPKVNAYFVKTAM